MNTYTTDDFLGGLVRLRQPKVGYRATSDSILLASAVKANSGDSLLDVGSATGIVALSVAARVQDIALTCVEMQPDLADMALQNADLNNKKMAVFCQNIQDKTDLLHGMQFNHIATNPPFYTEDNRRQNPQQDIAYKESIPLSIWIKYCLKHLRAKGTFTMIHRVESLPEILSILHNKLGSIEIIPIQANAQKPAKRLIIRGILNSKKPCTLLPPFIMHDLNGEKTKKAEKIMRQADSLD